MFYFRFGERIILMHCLGVFLCACTAVVRLAPSNSTSQTCSQIYPATILSAMPNLSLWLDSQDPSTVFSNTDCATGTLITDGLVGCWKDKSSNAYGFTSASGARAPTFMVGSFEGRNSLKFDDSRQTYLLGNAAVYGATGNTTLMVLEIPSNDQDRQILDTTIFGGATRRTIATDNVDFFYSVGALFFYAPVAYGQNRLVTVIENGVNSQVQEGGLSPTVGDTGAPNVSAAPTVIGCRHTLGSFFINSKIAEIVVVNRVLSAAELSSAQNYLACKYGFSL